MDNTFKISSSPHVRDKRSTQSIMLDVIIALLPATVFGIINFELNAMILILTCVVSCVLFEWLYQKMMNRKVTISDLSAVVTGLLLALNLSPDVPVWMAILGSAFAIITRPALPRANQWQRISMVGRSIRRATVVISSSTKKIRYFTVREVINTCGNENC